MRLPPVADWGRLLGSWIRSPRVRAVGERVLPGAGRGDWFVLVFALAGVLWCAWYAYTQPHPWDLKELARLADGTKRKYKEFLAPGLWYGAVVHLIVWLPVVLLARYWPKGEPARLSAEAKGETMSPRLFWGLMIALTVVAGVERWQRMDHSYWGDEGWAVTRYGHGLYRPMERGNLQGSMNFVDARWEQAFFDDHTGGNHYLFTVAQRYSLDVWRSLTGQPREAFSEVVSRLPPFIAGLACLPLLAGMLRWWGRPWTGFWAAFFLAAHPMHLRYSSEARGYSLMLCFLLCALWFAALALRHGGWRWWLLFGVAEFLSLYSWKGIYYGLGLVNGVVFLMIWFGRLENADRGLRPRFVATARWVVASLLMAGGLIHLVMPCALQGPEAMRIAGGRPMYLPWLWDAISSLFTGMPWKFGRDNPSLLAGSKLLAAYPGAAWTLMVIHAGLLLAGLVALARRCPRFGWMLFALAISCVAGALHFKYRVQVEWQTWYSFYVVPAICVVLAFGAQALGGLLGRWLPRGSGAWAGGVLGGAAFLAMTIPQTAYMLSHPVEANREAFEVTRGRHEPLWQTTPTLIHTVYLWRHIGLYDPRADTHVRTAASLKAKIEAVRKVDGELYVIMGERLLSQLLSPDMVPMLYDETLFDHTHTFHAQDDSLTLYVFHYKKPAKAVDGAP